MLLLDGLLSRGEITLLETYPDGRLMQATCIARVNAPIDRVWAAITDFAAYPEWMPQVRAAKIVSTGATTVVDWTLAVVGPDISFRQEATIDPGSWRVEQRQVSGALPGSRWEWTLEPEAGGTLVHRVVRNNVVDSNWLVRQVEDDNHTLDYGINSAVGVIEVKGLKRRVE